VFSTCIYCNDALGRNERIEHFPVGRRLAFDAHRGRLWVVCPACDRWNLSPLDERWQAIEECERLFSETRVRTSTDEIGLARMRDGLTLIRIGRPQRPEFAAWRYGDQFGRRRKRQLLVTGAALSAVGIAYVGGVWLAGATFVSFGTGVFQRVIDGRSGAVVARLRAEDGQLLQVRRKDAWRATIRRTEPDVPLAVQLPHADGVVSLEGDSAADALRRVLPAVNRFGGTPEDVQRAVTSIETMGGPEAMLSRLRALHGTRAELSHLPTRSISRWRPPREEVAQRGSLRAINATHRLALEMALHEEQERRALEGELDALADAWREAEEIAAIADGLLSSDAIEARLDGLKRSTLRAG
jgi:hypothetical protein